MNSVTVGCRGQRIFIRNNTTRRSVSMSWEAALVFGQVLRRTANRIIPSPQTVGPVRIRSDQEMTVLWEHSTGRAFLICPPTAAVEISNAIIQKARAVEEEVKADQVALDDALLQRIGVKIGLASNPFVKKMAGIEAAWNTQLRRWFPSSAKLLQHQVGTPAVRKNGQLGSLRDKPA